MTLMRIAWRNLWRRKRLTILLVLAIGAGIFSIILHEAFREGFLALMVDTAVNTSTGHIQIHESDYMLKKEVKNVIPDSSQVLAALRGIPHLTGISPRVLSYGLISSPQTSQFTKMCGIDPVREQEVTTVNTLLREGTLLMPDDMHGVYLGKALADKLKVGIGDKVVIMARDAKGDLGGSALRIRGIFHGSSGVFDKTTVFVTMKTARQILALPDDEIHEIALKVDRPENIPAVLADIRGTLAGKSLLAQSWQELSPVLAQTVEISNQYTYIIAIIIFVAMAFGIINTFYMKIFERLREYGIMMALGTRPSQIFMMLLNEAFLLTALGAVAGCFGAFFITGFILHNQVDYGTFSSALTSIGLPSVQPLIITSRAIVVAVAGALVTAILGTVLPALRASRFKPVEAIRYV